MFLDGSIREYVSRASAGVPTPGGGSIAALAGALGAAMSCMAANFTVGRKKFKEVESLVREQLEECLRARDALLRLVEEDAEAYAFVSAACGMPKATPEEKAAREEAIQQALLKAMTPPLETVRTCRRAMHAVAALVDTANPNLISDVGVSAVLLDAALRAAKMNVEINLNGLKDAELVRARRDEIETAAAETAALAKRTVAKVAQAIGGSV
jgi:formiminotetrahydrofolate cyclodeaminase